MASTRLPGSPATNHGEPMIVHVWRRAEAEHGPVRVAAGEAESPKPSAPPAAVPFTRPDHPSGSDRVFRPSAA
jgi:CMP-2-keto-3-deoxyoctulosonic acid synthetase